MMNMCDRCQRDCKQDFMPLCGKYFGVDDKGKVKEPIGLFGKNKKKNQEAIERQLEVLNTVKNVNVDGPVEEVEEIVEATVEVVETN